MSSVIPIEKIIAYTKATNTNQPLTQQQLQVQPTIQAPSKSFAQQPSSQQQPSSLSPAQVQSQPSSSTQTQTQPQKRQTVLVEPNEARFYCNSCNRRYGYFWQFISDNKFTPERWVCPSGCVWSGYYPRLASEIDGKSYEIPANRYNFYVGNCNVMKKGKKCFVSFYEVESVDPNYLQDGVETPTDGSMGIGVWGNGPDASAMTHMHDNLVDAFTVYSNDNPDYALEMNIAHLPRTVMYPHSHTYVRSLRPHNELAHYWPIACEYRKRFDQRNFPTTDRWMSPF